MKIHCLPIAIAAGLVMHLPAAETLAALRSPETAQTYADNSMLWHQLRWLADSHQLVATITFSNLDYVSRVEPRHDETFNFPLPGVKYAAQNGTFYLDGQPVARMHPDLIGHSIDLLPNARIVVTNHSGRVTIRMLADQPPTDGDRWVER